MIVRFRATSCLIIFIYVDLHRRLNGLESEPEEHDQVCLTGGLLSNQEREEEYFARNF